MPIRAKSVEMNMILTNSEVHLHHLLCESRGFKFGRSNHLRCSIKKLFWILCKIDRKTPMSESDIVCFLSILRNFWEHIFVFEQLKTLYNQWFGAVFWNRLSKKIEYSKENVRRWSPVYIKSWGNESNLSDFSRVATL